MKEFKEIVLISEIVLQSKIAQRANERLEATHESFDRLDVWSSIQSILVATGNISKILCPIYKKYEARGNRLRELLKVADDNPLLDRKFRNYFEHYDERIEELFNNTSSLVYRDLAMNPSFRGASAANVHRGYNSFNNTLIFRGEILDLNKVSKALEEILNNCRAYTNLEFI
jgi:hypothetical protein